MKKEVYGLFKKMKIHERKNFGNNGEEIASKYLKNNGYVIIERNFQCRMGEIDIIAKDLKKNEIVFVEVKSRTGEGYGKPSEAVDGTKIKHIYRVAKYYLWINGLYNSFVRFDVIEVLLKNGRFNVNHIQQII